MFLSTCKSMYHEQGPWKPEGGSLSPGTGISQLLAMWVLVIEDRSSGRAANDLYHRAIPLPPNINFKWEKTWLNFFKKSPFYDLKTVSVNLFRSIKDLNPRV